MGQTSQSLLILSDDQALAESLLRVVKDIRPKASTSYATYVRSPGILSARINDTDVFVLGLLRSYPGGLRAEGVALASLLMPRGKKVLIVSPLHIQALKDNPTYWDTASTAPLRDRIAQLVQSIPRRDMLAPLQDCFRSLLPIPPQH